MIIEATTAGVDILANVNVAGVIGEEKGADALALVGPAGQGVGVGSGQPPLAQNVTAHRVAQDGALCGDGGRHNPQRGEVLHHEVERAPGGNRHRHTGGLHIAYRRGHARADAALLVGVQDSAVQVKDDQIKGALPG